MSESSGSAAARELVDSLLQRGLKPNDTVIYLAACAAYCGRHRPRSRFEFALRSAESEGYVKVSADRRWITIERCTPR